MACALILLPCLVDAKDLTVTWEANSEPDIAGYRVYLSDNLGVTWEMVDVGNVLEYTWEGCTEDTLLLFSATAYNESGQESVKCPGLWWHGAWRRP